jgi:glycosyltransferase involved in cell wall biosynthesis
MKPLVSILIPAYNAEAWIDETITSALNQTWQRKEIIVVDDGSQDQTLAVARRFASKEVVVVGQENQGAAAARNHAFSLSQGDYLQWLDADDMLSQDKVASQLAAAAECQSARTLFSSGWGYFAYQTNSAEFTPTPLWRDLSPLEWLLRKLSDNLHMQTATWLVSRELTEAAGPWDKRLKHDDDGEYFCRVLLQSDGVRFVPEGKVFYRVTPSNRVSYIGRSDTKKDAMLLSMKLHVKYIRSLEESDRVRAACLVYLQNWLLSFYPERPDIVAELEKLATELGGQLERPRLRRKYAWLQPIVGYRFAKEVQMFLPELKQSFLRCREKVTRRLQGRKPRPSI